MDPKYEAIKSLYQEEINVYKKHIEELEVRGKESDDKNRELVEKIRQLQELVEKGHQANKDLHGAYEHVRNENLKLKSIHGDNQIDNIRSNEVPNTNLELALEEVQKQYVGLARESASWISDRDRLKQKIGYLERECERYNRDNVTLGKQVRHLLKTLEEERGMIIRRSDQIHDFEKPTCASDVIDQHLVTFESIEELQKQNQKLLSLVKELSKNDEDREMGIENDEIRQQKEEIETLKAQLENIKNDREHIMNIFNTILKERDLFKILLCKTREVEHMTPEIFQKMVSVACSYGPAITDESKDTQDKDAHILDLKAMITKLEDEINKLKIDLDETRSRSEKEINLKTNLLEQAHLKILSESQECDEYKERNQLLEINFKSLNEQYEEIKANSQKMVFEIKQLTEDKKELNEALERDKKVRSEELSNIIREIESKTEMRYELQLKVNTLERNIEDLHEELKKSQRYNEELQLKLNNSDRNVQDLNDKLTVAQKTNQELQITLSKANTQNQDLDVKLTNAREIETKILELQNNIRQQQDIINQRQDIINQQKEIINQQKDNISRLQNNIEQLKSNINQLQNNISELQKLRNIEREGRISINKKYNLLSKKFKYPVKNRTSVKRRHIQKQTDVEHVQMEVVETLPEEHQEIQQIEHQSRFEAVTEPHDEIVIEDEHQSKLQSGAQPQPEQEYHLESIQEPQPETQPETQLQTEQQLEQQPQLQPDTQPEFEIQPEPQNEIQPKLHSELKPEFQSEIKPDLQPQTEPQLNFEPNLQHLPEPQAEIEIEHVPQAQSEPQRQPESEHVDSAQPKGIVLKRRRNFIP